MSEPTYDDRLDDDARTMLAAFQAEEALPPDTQERVWARLKAGGHGRRTRRWSKVVAGVLAVAACVAIVALGAELLERHEAPEMPVQAEYKADGREAAREASEQVSKPSPTVPVEEPEEGPEARQAPEQKPRSLDPQSSRTGRADDKQAPPDRPTEDSMAKENAFMRSVQNALVAGDATHALALLDRWEREVPNGLLLQERSALRVVALCDAGKHEQGRPAARAFLRAYPGSVLAARVRGACREERRSEPVDHEPQRPRTTTKGKPKERGDESPHQRP